MPLISATRFRLRSPLYLPLVWWHGYWSTRQLHHADGFLGGRVLQDANWAFWTVTAWQESARMHNYRNTSAHRKAMPWLSIMCDEASLVHWQQHEMTLPDWQTIHQRMANQGRLSQLANCSKDHANGFISPPAGSDPFAGRSIVPKALTNLQSS